MLRTRQKIDCLEALKVGEKLEAEIKCSFQEIIMITEAENKTWRFHNVYIYIGSCL